VAAIVGAHAASAACDKENRKTAASAATVEAASPVVPATTGRAACIHEARDVAGCCDPGACKQARGAKSSVARRTATPTKRSKRTAPASRVASAPSANVAAAPAPQAKAPGTAGLVVAIDPETGRLVQPTAEQVPGLAPQSAFERSAAPLYAAPELVTLPDGAKLVRLNGRYMKHATVTIDAQGGKHYGCSSDPAAAAPSAHVSTPTAAAPRAEK
jgi:hypothetical protein